MSFNPIDLLKQTEEQLFLISSDYTVRFCNREEGMGVLCHKFFWGLDQPCADCGLQELIQSGKPFKKAGNCMAGTKIFPAQCHYQKYDNLALCKIEDRSKIIAVLKEVKGSMDDLRNDVNKKRAELVILKHKHKMVQRNEELLKNYHDCLSSGVLVINDKYEILLKNEKMDELGPTFFEPARAEPKTCHQWIYREAQPCGDCPLKQQPGFVGKHTRVIENSTQKAFITENFGRTEDHVVLTVSDSTRAIELAKKIGVQQDEMQALNRILREVLEFGAQLQRLDSEELIFRLTLGHLYQVFFAPVEVPSGFLLLHPSNRNPEFAVFHSMEKKTEKELFSEYLTAGTNAFSNNGFNLMEITGGKHSGNGFFFHQSEPFEEKRENILKIFLNMISALLENVALMRNLERKASVDGLTGAFNRAYFQQCFDAEKKKAAQINLPFSLVVIDINGLKEVNDVFGHEGGDKLIVSCGKLLTKLVREEDIVARYGGDEYVVLLPATGSKGLEAILNRFRENQHTATFTLKNNQGEEVTWPLRFSLGAASSDKDNFENIFQIADQRMYDDKEKFYQTHKRYR